VAAPSTPEPDFNLIIADLEALKRAGKVTEAKEILAGIPARAGFGAEPREVLGCLRAEFAVLDGNLAEASAMYDELLDQNPHLARALCGKGALAAESQDWTTAQAFFETSLDYNPSYDVALAGLGLCRMVQGQPEEAFALFTQAATANPENHRALLGVLQLGYPLKRYAEMEMMVLSYLKRYPANLDMIYSFAGLLYAQGRVNEARMQVEKILVVEPKHEPALELREILDKVDIGPQLVM
jgi:tetratricopeptide (TPR) repeat protein